jgi:hypothetical protein
VQPFIRTILTRVKCTINRAELLYRGGVSQVDLFKVATDNAVANLLGGPPLLRHLVCVQRFLRASTAISPVGPLKTAAQALVAGMPVAIAIARHLVHDGGILFCGFVGFPLRWLGKPISFQLLLAQDWGEFFAFGRRSFMIGRYFIGQLCRGDPDRKNKGEKSQKVFHSELILLQKRLASNPAEFWPFVRIM